MSTSAASRRIYRLEDEGWHVPVVARGTDPEQAAAVRRHGVSRCFLAPGDLRR